MIVQTLETGELYVYFFVILVSLFCGFIIGIERTRMEAQYGARDHIFFSSISTILIILYDKFLPEIGIAILIIITIIKIYLMNISIFIEIDPNSIKVNYFRENIIEYNRY